MARLSDTIEWDEGTAKRQQDRLRVFADHHRELDFRFGPLASVSERLISALAPSWDNLPVDQEASGFLLRAAEIAFVQGDTEQGMALLSDAYQRLLPKGESLTIQPYPGSFSDVVRAALLGVLLGRGRISLTPDFVRIVDAEREWIVRTTFPESPRTFLPMLPLALVLASEETIEPTAASFLRAALERPELQTALSASSGNLLLSVLGLLPGIYEDQNFGGHGIDLNRRDGYAALRELEREYGQRISSFAKDRYHWNRLRNRTPLLDWGLLAAQTLLIRLGARKPRKQIENESLDPIAFSWSLATSFAQRRQSSR